MGQHNSHIVNETSNVIKVILTDSNNQNATQTINPGQYVVFPTPRGQITVSVFRHLGSNQYNDTADASYTDNSDRSFIVKEAGGSLNIVRSVYGNIHQEES